MPIFKEEDKIHKALMKSQEKILNKMAKIEMDIHNHHNIHGGSIDIVGAFKNLGNTIKSGFEDKIINPVKQGFEEKIINPFEEKIINPIKENIPKSTQDLLDKIPDKIKNDPKFAKTIDFITKKKGGLASSLLHNALPATTSAIVGGLSGLASGNPFIGMAGSAAGGYAGKELSDYIGKKTGVGLRKKKGILGCGASEDLAREIQRRQKESSKEATRKYQEKLGQGMVGCGNFTPEAKKAYFQRTSQFMTPNEKEQYFNRKPPPPAPTGGRIRNISKEKQRKRSKKYYSSSSDSDSDFRPKRKTNNSALQQLLVANKDKEEKELKKSQLLINRHLAEEVKAVRGMRGAPPKFTGYGIKKLVGTKRGNRARGDIVAEVMKKEGLSLSQASKYVKEHDMY
jgi:hypothetical protein